MRGRDSGGWRRGNRDGNQRGGFNRGGFGRGRPRGGFRGRGFGNNRDGNRFSSNNQWQSRPKNETPGLRLTEEQIGVTQYMSDHEGFNGIIKSRYSDFQVSEINLQGEVAKLTSMEPPQPPAEEQVEEDEELLLNKYNVDILPMDSWDQINKVALGAATEPVQIDVTESSKEQRTRIHEAVKKAFGDSIVGSTVNIDNKKFVKFEKYMKGARVDNRVKWPWPAEYVHFLVHKENCDTMEAAALIAERLRSHIRSSMIGYAGTKDRRAKTTQWFSLRKTDPRKIAAACRQLRSVAVGGYSFQREHLRLGMLSGNRFRIALRNVTADEATVSAACSRLRDHGFVNYYGLQRFGTRLDVPTYHVGRLLLQGRCQEAIDAILSPREGPLSAALATYAARGAEAAAHELPRQALQTIEARVILALADKPNDLYYALQKIPRNTRLLYLHAYQSLLWNRCVSRRLQRAAAVLPGDLVAPELELEITDEDDESDNEESPEADKNLEETEKVAEETEKKPNKKQKEKVPVKVVTQEDVDNNKYTIFDIVMPLPGHFIEYPPNMKDYYEELLTSDGLKLDLKHKNKSYCLSGAYRRIAVRPRDVEWSLVRYSSAQADLLPSDLDLLRGDCSTGVQPDGEYAAVLLTLTLPPSCYATMALRELLRVDTSAHTQASMNDYHKRGGEVPQHGGKRAKIEGEGEQ